MRVEYSKSFVKTVKKQSGKTLDSIKTTIQEVKNASKIDDIVKNLPAIHLFIVSE